jgi:hypothetical protein
MYITIVATIVNVMSKIIQVSDRTYQELASIGKYGDTMDSIISRVLDVAKTTSQEECMQ